MRKKNRRRVIDEIMSKHNNRDKEIRFYTKDKEDKGANGEPYYCSVTNQYLTEEQMKEEEEKYRVIIFKTLYPEDMETQKVLQ